MAKKKTIETATSDAPRANESDQNTNETAVVSIEQPAPETPKKRSKKTRADTGATTNASATLQDCFAGYLAALENDGASVGTCFSYKMELQLAGQELGLETRLADLTPERVLEFFTSDRVMRTKSGREKAPPTFLKTRRVVRQALCWAADAKLIEKAPLPEDAATH